MNAKRGYVPEDERHFSPSAIQIIEKGKGTQFDPLLAGIMLQIIDDDREYKLHGQ